ncbi:Sodium/hydrogen exchanger 2 [Acorus calamus]|uniref:Sodium/hydrogen exchanger 2 n=1 Tax=Acorus calamus TaxID=4465 RepID=A0AAV9ET69_ACOCL|nr:Sodium/hydrogen exchanger 2 [Acorus calamus]
MSPGGRLWTADYGSVVSINIFVLLLCACIVIGHLLEETRWMNESTTALVIGLFTGVLLLVATGGKSSHILVFSEDLFFIYLLPPIIFNAGFQVKKKQFFHNFMTITLFGAIGTIISFTVISFGGYVLFKKLNIGPLKIGDFLAIGAIFSATDSVCTLQVLSQDETPLLYSLVFGEGVVNDAMSIVLFKTVQDFDLVHIDTGVAFQVGLLSAYIIKKLYFGRHSTDREVAIMILMAYFSYMLAELLHLSGILTVFFCGIVMSHYTWHNVTESSRITTRHVFATMSFIAEIFIFLYVGMDALDIEKWKCVSNSLGKSIGVSAILLVIIWWAGLMRGAVSMALAYNQFTRPGDTQLHGNAIMITSTITVVLFSTIVFGLMTKPLISLVLPPPAIPIQNTSSEYSNHKSLLSPLIGNGQASDSEKELLIASRVPSHPPSLLMLLTEPTPTIHYYWRKFDNAYMRPVFGGRGFVPLVQGSPTEQSVRRHAVK